MWRHRAHLYALVLGLLLFADAAAGQTPSDRPRYELGGQVSMLAARDSAIAVAGPHLTVNFGARSAVNVAGEWQLNAGGASNHLVLFRGQLEQSLLQSSGGNIFLTGGVGVWHNSYTYPSVTLPSGFTLPASSYSDTTVLFVVGGGFTRRIAQRLTLRADAEVLFVTGNPAFRLSAGLSLPMGRFQPETRASRSGIATPALGSFDSKVQPGKRVRVTSIDGREWHGTIRSVSNEMVEVDADGAVTALPFADIRRIETHGTWAIVKGAIIGAFAGGIPMGLYIGALCANEGCSNGQPVGLTMAFTALGAGVGAVVGAALQRGPHVIYDSSRPHTLAVAPVMSARGLGVAGTIRW